MGIELRAVRVLAACAYTVFAISVWELIKTLSLRNSYDCDGDASCLWRDGAHLQVQPGLTKASGHLELAHHISVEAGAGASLDGTNPYAVRQCLVRVFEHGTKPHESNKYSHLGEDGILDHIWECIAPESKSYIEIGVSDGTRCTTRQLRERGWAGLLLGSGPVNTSINLHTAAPTGDTIVRFLMQHSAPREPDLLAIYATLHTFWVLHAALQSGCRPRVIAAEINRNFHPADAFVAPHAPHSHWDGSTVFGASAGAFDVLFEQFGYATLAINQAQGTVFAVHKDAVGDERLMTMAKITAGVTATPLCQAAHTCNGDSRWLEVTKKAAVMMRLPRADWYNTLPAWTVRCERVTRPLGADQVQWGTPGPAEWLPTFEPGVVALLPCLPLADVAAVGAAMVAAQSGPPNNGTAEPPAASDGTNGTECGRQPEEAASVARKRRCLQDAFAEGSSWYETRRYSQYYEDGIIDTIFGCILTRDKFYVEFGVETGDECTTRHLREDGWTGLLMDGGHHRPELNLQQEFFNAEGIAYQLHKHAVPLRFDHLTIDIDQNTFWVLHAVLLAGYRPRVIVAEINRNFHPTDAFAVPYVHDKTWGHPDMSGDFGASAGAFDALFAAFGYHTAAVDQDQINIYAVQACEAGPERLFSMADVTRGLSRHGPCLGIHACNDGEHLQVTDEVAQLLTQPRAAWYDKMPRWHIVCSEPLMQGPARTVRILTGARKDGRGAVDAVPRFPPEAVTAERCAAVAQASAAAAALQRAALAPQ